MKMIDLKHLGPVAILACLMLLLLSCGGQNGSQEELDVETESKSQVAQGEPVMHFDTLIHDFGTIIEGERVVCYFDYQNLGGEDLLITSVETTCGCTAPTWSRKPLGPGEKESMKVFFDTSGRRGEQRKLVTINSNASNGVIKLTIRARINNSV